MISVGKKDVKCDDRDNGGEVVMLSQYYFVISIGPGVNGFARRDLILSVKGFNVAYVLSVALKTKTVKEYLIKFC
jgi:hypothetical protein